MYPCPQVPPRLHRDKKESSFCIFQISALETQNKCLNHRLPFGFKARESGVRYCLLFGWSLQRVPGSVAGEAACYPRLPERCPGERVSGTSFIVSLVQSIPFCSFVCVCVCVTLSSLQNPQSGIELMPPAIEVQSPNHWTTREFPQGTIYFYFCCCCFGCTVWHVGF